MNSETFEKMNLNKNSSAVRSSNTVLKRKKHSELCSWLDIVCQESKECMNDILLILQHTFSASMKHKDQWTKAEAKIMSNWEMLEKRGNEKVVFFTPSSVQSYLWLFTEWLSGKSSIPEDSIWELCRKAANIYSHYLRTYKSWKQSPHKLQSYPAFPELIQTDQYPISLNSHQCQLFQTENKVCIKIKDFPEVRIALPEGYQHFYRAVIIPYFDSYRLKLVCKTEQVSFLTAAPTRTAEMDVHIGRYLAMLTGPGISLIIGDEKVRDIAVQSARKRARLMAVQTEGKIDSPIRETKRTAQIRKKAENTLNSMLHEESRRIIEWLELHQIDTLIIKPIREYRNKAEKQTFFHKAFQPVSSEQFVFMVKYKAESKGIRVLRADNNP